MKCPYCNQEHEEDTVYCPRTGKKIENPVKACGNPDCPKFGMYILSPDSEFCPKCGKPITVSEEYTFSEAKVNTDKSNRPYESFSSPYIYDEIYDYHEGLAQVRRNGRVGFIDITGEEIIPCSYERLESMFIDGYCKFLKEKDDGSYDDYVGIIDRKGNEIIPCIYDSVYYDDDVNAFCASKDGKEGVIGKNGITLVPFAWDSISQFYGGLALAKNNGGQCVIDINGNAVCEIPSLYNESQWLFNGLVAVKKGNKWGCIDTSNSVQIDFIYDSIKYGSRKIGHMVVSRNGHFGLINKQGVEIAKCQYAKTYKLLDEEIIMLQRSDGYWNLFNIEKEYMIPGNYKRIHRLSQDGSYVSFYSENDLCGLINESGNVIIAPTKYKIMSVPHEGFVNVCYHDDEEASYHEYEDDFNEDDYDFDGLINMEGEEVVPCIYEELSYPENGLMVAKFRGKHIIINTKNELVFPNGVDVSEWEEANSYYVD